VVEVEIVVDFAAAVEFEAVTEFNIVESKLLEVETAIRESLAECAGDDPR
jgi:hypothetical protein